MDRLCTHPPDHGLASARAYLATVARNLARDWLTEQTTASRGGGQVSSLDDLPPGLEPADWRLGTAEAALYRVLAEDLQAHMARHASAKEFAVWQLIFDARTGWLTYLTNREMGEILREPKGSVDRWASAARTMAREFIRNYDAEPGGEA